MDLLTDIEQPGAAASGRPGAEAAAAVAAPAPGSNPAEGAAPAGEKTWLDTLPPDLKDNPSLARYKESGVEGIARAYVNAEKLIGSEKVPVPKDPNDQEAWDRYYKAGGRPEEPGKYEFKRPETLPEGVTYDEQMEGWWKQSAFEAGLSQRQADRLYKQYADRFVANLETQNKSIETQVTTAKMELQRDWGAEYEAKRALAKAAFAEMPEDARAAAVNSGLARMPSFVKYLYDIKARTTGETAPKEGNRIDAANPAQMQAKIAEFRAQHQVALMDNAHPEHDLRVRELSEMFTKAYPVEAA